MTATALKNVLPVTSCAHLACKRTPGSIKDALEPPRMLALVVVKEFVAHFYHPAMSFLIR